MINSDPHRKQLGHWYELEALEYLQRQGLTLITQNFFCKMGEIDLIMQDQDWIVFVEVRMRSNNKHGCALESITIGKQQKIIRAARLFLQKRQWYDKAPCRFDVVAIGQTPNQDLTLDWVKSAFTA